MRDVFKYIRDDNVLGLKMFICGGGNVNVANIRGETPLHWAYQTQNDEMVKLLIKAGADENAKDRKKLTPKQWLFMAKKQRQNKF